MTIKATHKHEAGQVLPILALALVALLGFAALALDGGNLYTEQRRAQAAADNAVMAAAFAQMNGTTSTAALANIAYANASQNGYTLGGPGTTMAFHSPPAHGVYAGDIDYMEVVITQTVPTALAHLVYKQNPIPLTVIAIAHGRPTGPIMPGYALVALKKECGVNGTIYMEGNGGGNNGGVFLTDGGAFVNAACDNALTTSGNHDGIVTDGPPISIAGTVYDGNTCASLADGWDTSVNCNFYPAPTTGATQVDQDPLANTPAGTKPPCGPARVLATEMFIVTGTRPGTYTTMDAGNSDLTMQAGIYCLSGGSLSSKGTITGIGVLVYMTTTATLIDFSGNGAINVSAPTTTSTGCAGVTDTTYDICPYLGILVYKTTGTNNCGANDHDIDFTGTSSMNIKGLIYAPLSLVRYGGGGSMTMTGQTIAACVKFNGNGRMDIIYDPNATYGPPPAVTLDQ